MATKSYDQLLKEVDNKRQKLASANQMLAANDAQRVHTRYSKDKESGVVVQSAELARVLKGESGMDGLLKRFASASGMSRKDIYGMAGQYTGADESGGLAVMNPKQDDTSADLLVGVNLYTSDAGARVGYNVVDLLDNVYTQLKKKHQVPALPTFRHLSGANEEYVTGNDPNNGGDYKSGKKLTSSNVKDIRDFAKKALLPYVTAFFRAFELSDEMIHAAIEAKTDTNAVNPLTSPVLPVDTRGRMMYALTTEGLGEALALASMGSDPLKRMMPMIDFAFATSRVGGANQEGGKKKKKSSKKRSSGRKMRGGEDMEGGKKKKSSSKKRSSGKRRGGAKKRSSKKRSSSRKH